MLWTVLLDKYRNAEAIKMENNRKCEKCIDGIVCNVVNCTYHAEGNVCTAGQIAVGPRYAESSADTVCATFKPQE